jgi:hypothetical protein
LGIFEGVPVEGGLHCWDIQLLLIFTVVVNKSIWESICILTHLELTFAAVAAGRLPCVSQRWGRQ